MEERAGIYVVEPDIPAHMTIAAYRRSRHSRARWWRRILVGRGAAGHP